MTKNKQKPGISYHDWEVNCLRSDRGLAVEYLKTSMESLPIPEERAGALLSLRAVAEAYGLRLSVIPEHDISREVAAEFTVEKRA